MNWRIVTVLGIVLTFGESSASGQPVRFTKIVDTNTPIPGGTGSFVTLLGSFSNGPSLSNGNIAFNGAGSSAQRGIYTNIGGQLDVLVDTGMPIPGGSGLFTDFGPPSLSGTALAFRGFGSDSQQGIYSAGGSGLAIVADNNDDVITVVRELSADLSEAVPISIPGRGEFVGDRIVIAAEDAKLRPSAQTRIEMLGANTGPLVILQETTVPPPEATDPDSCSDQGNCIFDGFPNSALGNATLSLERVGDQNALQVDDIGSSLADGVAQLVPETMEMETTLFTPNFSLSTEGATLVTNQIGTVEGQRDQLFSSMTITNTGDRLEVNGDWSYIGTSNYEIQVYRSGELVTAQTGLPSGQATITGTPDITRQRCHLWIIIIYSMFYSFDTPSDLSLPNLAFCGADGEGQVREYSSNAAGDIRVVADEHTPIPGGTGNFTNFDFLGSLDDGTVGFHGFGANNQEGIYTDTGGQLNVIADRGTGIPGGSGTFAAFGSFSIESGNVAFHAYGSGGQEGIYTAAGGRLSVVADANTPLPEGSGVFSHFGASFFGPSLTGGRIAFLGGNAAGLTGIYVADGSSLRKVVDNHDMLDGRSFSDFAPYMSSQGFDGQEVAFHVLFNDLSEAIFVASLPIPVGVDVKPGNSGNPINPGARGVVPVALLGSDTFDVADVDVTTLAFGPGDASPTDKKGGHFHDVNRDGFTDLLSHYRIEDAAIGPQDAQVCLTGETLDGTPFEGCDSIRRVGRVHSSAAEDDSLGGAAAEEGALAAGEVNTSGTDAPARAFGLATSTPNPVRRMSTIRYVLPEPSRVRIAVYDVRGRLVTVLVDGREDAGDHSLSWNLASRPTASVSSGMYFCRMHAMGLRSGREFTQARKVVVVP